VLQNVFNTIMSSKMKINLSLSWFNTDAPAGMLELKDKRSLVFQETLYKYRCVLVSLGLQITARGINPVREDILSGQGSPFIRPQRHLTVMKI